MNEMRLLWMLILRVLRLGTHGWNMLKIWDTNFPLRIEQPDTKKVPMDGHHHGGLGMFAFTFLWLFRDGAK